MGVFFVFFLTVAIFHHIVSATLTINPGQFIQCFYKKSERCCYIFLITPSYRQYRFIFATRRLDNVIRSVSVILVKLRVFTSCETSNNLPGLLFKEVLKTFTSPSINNMSFEPLNTYLNK